MRILITNDDGARADGIKLLEEIALSFTDDVWVVAPEFDQSGVSHAISLHEPLRVHQAGEKRYFVKGTPADCVVLAVEHLMDRKPDLVLSGVNRGGNMADSIAYSGTVGAAMTALAVGVPAIALSQMFRGVDIHWETARTFAKPLIERLLAIEWPRPVAPNINFPACPPEEVTGVSICRPGHGLIEGVNVTERVDVRGGSYYWLQFRRAKEVVEDRECDYGQLLENKITITPLRPDRHSEGDWEDFRAEYADALAVAPLPKLG
ncbi:5'/3'-nucleotidase SurE [Acuticoccus kandeliae]|uniref:5'/3'-nucleotidase SurE n=1 Tax=Acuticoccus kandeliae TaxID=2073160 RepID=UPI000D3EB5E6|nr:5'/3'-nucleotidase SurE [Acuticoccus kandeliae]